MISLVTQWYEKVMAKKRVFLEDVETDKWQGNHVNGIGISLKKMYDVCASAYNKIFDPLFYVSFLLRTDHTSWTFTLHTCINTYIHTIVHAYINVFEI